MWGVRNVRWIFPDGYVYNSSIDGVVEHRPKKSGNVQVTLTDNLGNEQMIPALSLCQQALALQMKSRNNPGLFYLLATS
jgi:hypothetical protein